VDECKPRMLGVDFSDSIVLANPAGILTRLVRTRQ
jgi:hypothetical protein